VDIVGEGNARLSPTTLFLGIIMGRNIKGKILAPVAFLIGVFMGRPLSATWLFHYLWGSGKDRKLPRRYEQELLTAYLRFYVRVEGKRRSIGPMTTGDLYTTVGEITVWEEDGRLFYHDKYDWHPGKKWVFDAYLFGLPFTICVRGKDEMFNHVGKSFATKGSIKIIPENQKEIKHIEPLVDLTSVYNDIKYQIYHLWWAIEEAATGRRVSYTEIINYLPPDHLFYRALTYSGKAKRKRKRVRRG